jgi:hypothetical protein
VASLTWGDRKLKDVVRELASLGEQGKVEGFFNNAENAGKLGGLVEDIRDAMMDYQVCAPNLWIPIRPNICDRPRCSKASTTDSKASTINNKISTRSNKISTTRVAQSW